MDCVNIRMHGATIKIISNTVQGNDRCLRCKSNDANKCTVREMLRKESVSVDCSVVQRMKWSSNRANITIKPISMLCGHNTMF